MAQFTERYAVVTGGNKGIGFEICKQLASKGITVVLTARDEKRGLEAIQKLNSNHVFFHQLDVMDLNSITSLALFITSRFPKLDILVNNAGIGGAIIEDADAFSKVLVRGIDSQERFGIVQNYDLAVQSLQTNYYGAKRTTEALLPLLHLSDSPRIVNVSSSLGRLKNIPNESVKRVLNDVENLTEDKIDEIIDEFLRDFKEGFVEDEAKGWPQFLGGIQYPKQP